MRRPIVIDLFCGAGGLSKGFEMAGFKILAGLDNDKWSIQTFKKNHKRAKIINEDIRKVSGEDIEKLIKTKNVDVIAGGPPCQGFSIAGRRDPKDPRNSLFMEFIKIVNYFKPEWVVMENVLGIKSMKTEKSEAVVDIIKNEFGKIGYDVVWKTLNSADYGVPQKRRRVFFMAHKDGKEISFPVESHSKNPQRRIDGSLIERWVPVSNVLLNESEIGKNYFHTPKMIEGFRRRKQRNIENKKGFGWQILRMNEPSYTISARYWKDGSEALVMYSPERIRMLTERECARIQSFPDDFIFLGPKKEVYKQIGNAVPPLLSKAIAELIKTSYKSVNAI
jgi:DNA (cytosine-5)-methyltransferase 1